MQKQQRLYNDFVGLRWSILIVMLNFVTVYVPPFLNNLKGPAMGPVREVLGLPAKLIGCAKMKDGEPEKMRKEI